MLVRKVREYKLTYMFHLMHSRGASENNSHHKIECITKLFKKQQIVIDDNYRSIKIA